VKTFSIFAGIFLIIGAGCSPTGSTNNTDNTNNVNNSNNVNNVNNVNNSNNVNNINNVNNVNNSNNVNNTNNTGDCGPNNLQCEEWQYCLNNTHCETYPGRCAGLEDCGDWEECKSNHYCGRIDPGSCNFTYDQDFPTPVPGAMKSPSTTLPPYTAPELLEQPNIQQNLQTNNNIHQGPWPSDYYILPINSPKSSVNYLIMPDYADNMPLFERGLDWAGTPRCYETPNGAQLLFEDEAYDLYVDIVEITLGADVNQTPGFRTVIGLRGAYPGTFFWNLNSPDVFNDTMVLLWIDSSGQKRVKEFPVHTDTGDNTYTSTSSLLPNRRYKYVNGTHRGYNALAMYEWNYGRDYHTADDANANGHWDCDRNGWLNSGSTLDYVRIGSAHNIHMGSVYAPLGQAHVGGWSAGCQVHSGMANWTEFITNAWTGSGDIVDYFLIDTRDISQGIWNTPCSENGTHDCPWIIDSLPYSHSSTTIGSQSIFDSYNCSTTNESGPENVYLLKVNQAGTINVSVDCQSPVDIDIHLLAMDDSNACLVRNHTDFSWPVVPGRYLIIADTWVDGTTQLSGAYTLNVNW
jgi:hypothetical protein